MDTQRNGSLMEKEAGGGREGRVHGKGKERKEEGERGQSTYIRRGENVSRDRMEEAVRRCVGDFLKPFRICSNITSPSSPHVSYISPDRLVRFVRSELRGSNALAFLKSPHA